MVSLLSGTVVSVFGEGCGTAEWADCLGFLVTDAEHLAMDHIVDQVEDVQTQLGRNTVDESVEFTLVFLKLVILDSTLHARLYACTITTSICYTCNICIRCPNGQKTNRLVTLH